MTLPANPPAEKAGDTESTPTWLKRVPMITGVLAGLAGFLTVRSTNMTNQANYNSTMAVLHQAESSDAWSEYQADSLKRHIDETALEATVSDPAAKSTLTADIGNYKTRQQKAQSDATDEANKRDEELANGQQKLNQRNMLDYAGVTAQLGIALASVAALTRKKAAFDIGLLVGVLALAITGYAIAMPYIARFFAHH
jgi:hypothetical protein